MLAQRLSADRLLPLLVYPATVGAVVAAYLLLLARQAPVVAATYAALSLAFVSVIVGERLLPYRMEWKAGRAEQGQDFLFMALIHLLFTKFLGFATDLWVLKFVETVRPATDGWWPHDWPVLAQGVLMVLLVDFVRYWLHRACHTYPLLWRLHAVHHSPKRLYWLNVGRFHPVERTFQFLLDSFPFMLLGVDAQVLGMYFLLFATNGLFQHCNIRLAYGWLNWVVSSAELHRWHHSRVVDESNRNYSNTTILWDIVFGTRFLPAGRAVGELGLTNPRYPTDFLSQMRTPFIDGIEVRDVPFLGLKDIALNHLLRFRMLWQRLTLWPDFLRACDDPAARQRRLLGRILKANRDTEFGKAHGFAELAADADPEAYRLRVPVQSYEDHRPFIEEQARTGRAMLTGERPAMYNQTSGTTGSPKLIPLVPSALARAARLQKLFSLVQYDFRRPGFQGKLLGIVSPAVEGRLPTGQPFGSASGTIYRDMPRVARAKYVLPYEVLEVEDYAIRYYLILRLALAERDITHIGTANPSTLLKMLEVVAERKDDLLEDLRTGACRHLDRLPERVAAAVRSRLSADPARADGIRILMDRTPAPDFKSLWPHLKLVTTWTGGSCGIALAKLRPRLPDGARIFELGYLASEFRGTLTVDGKTGDGVPTLDDTYFEFVEKSAWEAGRKEFLGVEALAEGGEYYVFITTPSGLYRYAMNDIVRVTGRFRNTPTLRFLQKGKGVTNITGEKLYESQALAAVHAEAEAAGMKPAFFQFLADEEAARYVLYLEAEPGAAGRAEEMARRIDARLGVLNLEYQAKRAGDRLKPLVLLPLRPGAGEAYKRHFLAKGQREVQFKPQPLLYRKDLDMDLDAWAATR